MSKFAAMFRSWVVVFIKERDLLSQRLSAKCFVYQIPFEYIIPNFNPLGRIYPLFQGVLAPDTLAREILPRIVPGFWVSLGVRSVLELRNVFWLTCARGDWICVDYGVTILWLSLSAGFLGSDRIVV